MLLGKITKNIKKILIFFAIAAALALSFIFILNATETSPPPPEGCPFSLPEQGNLDGRLMRNPRTNEFIRKIQDNEGNAITGTTTAERVIQIAHLAVKCEVTLGSCGNTVGTFSWLAGVQGLERITTTDDRRGEEGQIAGRSGTSIREISREQTHDICAINCGLADCSKPCTEASQDMSGYEKRRKVYSELKDEIQERGQSEEWPDLWANLLQPGDGIVVYNVTSEPGGSHYAIFLGWEDEEAGKANVIEGAWGKLVEEDFIYLKKAHGARRPLLKITRPE